MYHQQTSQKASASIRTTPNNQDIAPSQSYGFLSSVVQRVQQDPNSVSEDERQQLESAIGSRSTKEILAGKQTPWIPNFSGISQQLWSDSGQPIQAKGSNVQPKNQTGLPDNLKAGLENLSGMAMDDVRVHYKSPKPAQLQALAYTQGTDIHIAPGQEKHLPHEAWHVVQQMQGRVKPTRQLQPGVALNDNAVLEQEADVMGAKILANATQLKSDRQENLSEKFNDTLQGKFATVQRNGTKDEDDPWKSGNPNRKGNTGAPTGRRKAKKTSHHQHPRPKSGAAKHRRKKK